jgi:hypothetical protein
MIEFARPLSFDQLVGKTLSKVEMGSNYGGEVIVFTLENGDVYYMGHQQDCCESVSIEEIHGDLEDLVGSPILKSTVASNDSRQGEYGDVEEWTFYHISTIKGTVTVRWYGTSNGYYSTSVDFWLHERARTNGQ